MKTEYQNCHSYTTITMFYFCSLSLKCTSGILNIRLFLLLILLHYATVVLWYKLFFIKSSIRITVLALRFGWLLTLTRLPPPRPLWCQCLRPDWPEFLLANQNSASELNHSYTTVHILTFVHCLTKIFERLRAVF